MRSQHVAIVVDGQSRLAMGFNMLGGIVAVKRVTDVRGRNASAVGSFGPIRHRSMFVDYGVDAARRCNSSCAARTFASSTR